MIMLRQSSGSYGQTYSLKLVTTFLQKNKIKYKYCSANVGFMLQEHGCGFNIDDTYRYTNDN
jgi:hypothetical protein